MASNPYVNKVVYGGTTLIDISDTTATADKILSGYGAYGADGRWMDGTAAAGSGSAIAVVDTLDANGGTIRTITAVSLEGDTVAADKLLSGYTAHNSLGEAITGTYVPSSTNTQSNKTVSPTESQQVVTPDTGYDNLAQVTVNAVANGTVTAPSSISGSSATISTGTNTLTLTKTVSVTPNVTTAGYISSGTVGNSSVSLTTSVTTKAAATITPTKSTQTIASGTYLTGTQTIAAIPAAYQDVTGVTAAAGDVVSGKTIVDSTGATVNGSLVINKYYTGSSNPSASLGNNGDLYLKV